MLQKAYVAAKYADPAAVVVFGGMAQNGVRGWEGWERDFIQHVYDHGGGRYFDIMAIHPYTHPDEGLDHLVTLISEARAVLDTNDDSDVPIWLTEVGWPIPPVAWGRRVLTNEELAEWLVDGYYSQRVLDLADKVFWYNFRDSESKGEGYFGLVTGSWERKPQYYAYQQVACELNVSE